MISNCLCARILFLKAQERSKTYEGTLIHNGRKIGYYLYCILKDGFRNTSLAEVFPVEFMFKE